MKTLARGLMLGLAFGLAAAAVELCMNLVPFVQRRFGPGPLFFARVAALELLLGALLGLVAAPLLRARGSLDDTILVVLADHHGEVLGERDGFFGHDPSLYQESIGVPLLVRYPPRVPAGAGFARSPRDKPSRRFE